MLATRILKSRRDRLITATLTTLIPCSARMTIIFGLIGFFISMKAAVFVYVANLLLLGLVGKMMSLAMPETEPRAHHGAPALPPAENPGRGAARPGSGSRNSSSSPGRS